MRTNLLEIHIRAADRIVLPEDYRGNILRGAFGMNLRRMVCVYPDSIRECVECPAGECVYRDFFNPVVSPGSERLSRNKNIQRPFVLRPPSGARDAYSAGDLIVMEMVVFGNAFRFLPYILVTLHRLAENGLGRNRGKACLERVVQKNPVTGASHCLYSSDSGIVNPREMSFSKDDYSASSASRIRISFITPAILKDKGHFIEVPEFETVIKRLRDRFAALSWFYEGVVPDIDFREFAAAAQNVSIVRADTFYEKRSRRARGGAAVQFMNGFTGTMEYTGELTEFIPYLKYGQYMHIGKSAVFGFGQYSMEILG